MRRVTVVLPLAAAVVALAGCSSSDDSADAVQSSASATTSISTSAVASAPTATATAEDGAVEPAPTQTATQVVPPATATVQPTAADVDCSLATPPALLTAVEATEISSRMVDPIAFTDIRCAGPFAVGRSAPPDTQGADVLFRRDGGRWVALDLGSAIDYARWGATPDQVSRLVR